LIRIAWKLAGVLVALAVAGGCAQRAAPVVERSPMPAKPPSPRAAIPAAPAIAAPVVVPPGFYVVKPGDTLYSIALEHGTDYRDVARWNGLEDPTKIHVTQLLRVSPPEGESGVLVGTARGAGRPEARPLDAASIARQGQGDSSTKTAPKALRLPYSKENVALVSRDTARPAPPPASIARMEPAPEAKPRDPDGVGFIWPAKGPVIGAFGQRTKGLDIGGNVGDPILAAAPGKVTYVGSGIPGMGKFLIIRHENEFLTVYAHTSQIFVKEQQMVSRGQKIAEIGATDADKPKLHFQIRRAGNAIDPLRFLPSDNPS
jgi:lipoprotein NlpD